MVALPSVMNLYPLEKSLVATNDKLISVIPIGRRKLVR